MFEGVIHIYRRGCGVPSVNADEHFKMHGILDQNNPLPLGLPCDAVCLTLVSK